MLALAVHATTPMLPNRAGILPEDLGRLYTVLLQPSVRGVCSVLQQDQSSERLSAIRRRWSNFVAAA